MLYSFRVEGDTVHEAAGDAAALKKEEGLLWVDVVEPSEDELQAVQRLFGIEFGSLEELQNTEASARFMRLADDQMHMRADFLGDGSDGAENTPTQFVVTGGVLLSVHKADLPTFRVMRAQMTENGCRWLDAKSVLLEIYATDAEHSADVLEGIHRQLKGASRSVLTREVTDKIAAAVLSRLAVQENLNGNVRHNVADSRRAISFLMREGLLDDGHEKVAREIRRDLDALDSYTAFLFDKINFLMDATVGFLTVSQNNVIKTFSVAAVAMLPPTLIASIYGMNFEHMPELDWMLGYPFALALMALSVAVPFWLFYRRGWLR
jgi:magnesium transporter